MDHETQAWLEWVKTFEQTGDAGLTCRRCGISRPTLGKWVRRYEAQRIERLASRSHRPHHQPQCKIHPEQEQWILALRRERKLGARRIQNELYRAHRLRLSLRSIQKILQQHGLPVLPKRQRKKVKRYEARVPGERIQMDICKLGAGLYLYTAIDDCSRSLVVGLYPRRTAEHTLDFIQERLLEESPRSIQRIQTDHGTEFMALKVSLLLHELHIRFRPIRPGAPHLNGKVGRAQRTVLDEFFSTTNRQSPELVDRLGEWQFDYNWYRVHGSLGKTPTERIVELSAKTPYWYDVYAPYEDSGQTLSEPRASPPLRRTRRKRFDQKAQRNWGEPNSL